MSGSIEALCRTAFSGRKRVRSGESSSSTANAVGGTRRRAGRGARNDEALGDGEDDEEDEGEGVEEANISRSSNHGGTTATSKAPPPPPRLPSSSRGPVVTAPQLEFVDGKFVVRESSLVLGHDSLPSHLTLEEGVVDHPATYTSYRMKTFNSKAPWGVEETRTFYRAIQQVGLDYSLLQSYMPGRTRKQIKHKFFREDKKNPSLIQAALNNRVPLDAKIFQIDEYTNTKPSESTGDLLAAHSSLTQTILQPLNTNGIAAAGIIVREEDSSLFASVTPSDMSADASWRYSLSAIVSAYESQVFEV